MKEICSAWQCTGTLALQYPTSLSSCGCLFTAILENLLKGNRRKNTKNGQRTGPFPCDSSCIHTITNWGNATCLKTHVNPEQIQLFSVSVELYWNTLSFTDNHPAFTGVLNSSWLASWNHAVMVPRGKRLLCFLLCLEQGAIKKILIPCLTDSLFLENSFSQAPEIGPSEITEYGHW